MKTNAEYEHISLHVIVVNSGSNPETYFNVGVMKLSQVGMHNPLTVFGTTSRRNVVL